jgi:hypothetical protein
MAKSTKAATSTKRKEGSRAIKKTSKAKAADDARGKKGGPKRKGARKSKVFESLVDGESERGGSEDDDGSGGEDDVQVECVFALHTHVPTDVFQPVGRSRNSPGPS